MLNINVIIYYFSLVHSTPLIAATSAALLRRKAAADAHDKFSACGCALSPDALYCLLLLARLKAEFGVAELVTPKLRKPNSETLSLSE